MGVYGPRNDREWVGLLWDLPHAAAGPQVGRAVALATRGGGLRSAMQWLKQGSFQESDRGNHRGPH
jgi:hypothetical protein